MKGNTTVIVNKGSPDAVLYTATELQVKTMLYLAQIAFILTRAILNKVSLMPLSVGINFL